jgi:hypothetical protein
MFISIKYETPNATLPVIGSDKTKTITPSSNPLVPGIFFSFVIFEYLRTTKNWPATTTDMKIVTTM